MILKATFALGAALAMQALPASAQDAASATTATSSLKAEFEPSGIPTPRLIAVIDDEPGWRPVEIILSDASRSLSNANKAVCGDERRDAELRKLRARVRTLLDETQRAIGDVRLIIPMDPSTDVSCDSYPALVASARAQMSRVEALLPSLARK
jgi:hypothetical protein